MKKDKVAGLIDPDIFTTIKNFNLPMTVAVRSVSPLTFDNFLRNGTKTINGHFDFGQSRIDEIVTKFGLHYGNSVKVSLRFVKG